MAGRCGGAAGLGSAPCHFVRRQECPQRTSRRAARGREFGSWVMQAVCSRDLAFSYQSCLRKFRILFTRSARPPPSWRSVCQTYVSLLASAMPRAPQLPSGWHRVVTYSLVAYVRARATLRATLSLERENRQTNLGMFFAACAGKVPPRRDCTRPASFEKKKKENATASFRQVSRAPSQPRKILGSHCCSGRCGMPEGQPQSLFLWNINQKRI